MTAELSKDSKEGDKPDLPLGVEAVKNLFIEIVSQLNHYNAELLKIESALKTLQPKRSGVVLLELYNCGQHCRGCQHPRWVQWSSRIVGQDRLFVRHILQTEPVRKLKKSGPFEENHDKVKSLVKYAKHIIEKRAKLLESIGNLSRSLQ